MPRDASSLLRNGSLDSDDHAALAAVSRYGGALCTVVGIEGSFSRRPGAQLAVLPDGSIAGSLSDGCLEAQLRHDCRDALAPQVIRYGRGSTQIDFRLPCGGGLDILIDPAPDREACEAVLCDLQHRRESALALPANDHLAMRRYVPGLVVRIFGKEPEVGTIRKIGEAAGIACEVVPIAALSLGRPSGLPPTDRWTAVVALFHDHEWEAALIEEALASDAFYVGAQGGFKARTARINELTRRGVTEESLARLRSPIGVPTGSRSPQTLALSVLSEIAGEYELLRPQF